MIRIPLYSYLLSGDGERLFVLSYADIEQLQAMPHDKFLILDRKANHQDDENKLSSLGRAVVLSREQLKNLMDAAAEIGEKHHLLNLFIRLNINTGRFKVDFDFLKTDMKN